MSKIIYHFPEIKGKFCEVKYSKNQGNTWETFKVEIKDRDLNSRIAKYLPPLSADLIDLGTAIFISDWLTSRHLHGEPSEIIARLPIRNAQLFSEKEIGQELKHLLNWFTEDHWKFEFISRKSTRKVESQSVLPINLNKNIEVALWSGGLDSLAGLYSKYKQNTSTKFCLVGTGSNKQIIGNQKSIIANLKKASKIKATLKQIPFYLEETRGESKFSYMRSRGLTFMLIGAAVCLAMEKHTLNIYENGIGALNLPYRKSEVGLDHTRSVHPLSLIKTSKFLSNLIGKPFSVQNPFIFQTKAQMCNPIIADKLNRVVFETITCDGLHRSDPSQCGYCSSCLLRRQSILANNIEDKTGYVLTDSNPKKENLQTHIDAMLHQVKNWDSFLQKSGKVDDQWRAINRDYPQLERTVISMSQNSDLEKSQIRKNFMDMYRTYCKEWNKTADIILKSYPQYVNQ